MAEGLENCVVLLRELRGQGYTGGYSVLKEYLHPFRRPHLPQATRRFETDPGEQAQVDWGSFTFLTARARRNRCGPSSWSSASPGPSTWNWHLKPTWPHSSGAASTP